MSRNRKRLDEQKGHLTKEQQENIKMTEDASQVDDDQLRYAPRWLTDKVAQEEWRRLLKEMRKAGIICNLDRNNLALYCNCFSDYLRICRKLKDMLPADEKAILSDETMEQFASLIRLRKTVIDDMMKISRTCGLTLDSRLKAGQLKIDSASSAIEDAFGDI